MAQKETTPQHCPGYATFKSLKSFTCNCPSCGAEKKIFSDEFDRPNKCSKCGKPIDFTNARSRAKAKACLRGELAPRQALTDLMAERETSEGSEE